MWILILDTASSDITIKELLLLNLLIIIISIFY